MQKNLEKNYAEVLNLKRHYSLTDAVPYITADRHD